MEKLRTYSKLIAITLSITMILGIFAVYAANTTQTPNITVTEATIDFTTQNDNIKTEATTIEMFSAPPPNTTELSLGSTTGSPGDTVTIPLRIFNNPGFSTYNFIITYDTETLEPLSVMQGNSGLSHYVANLKAGTISNRYIRVVGASGSNCSVDGTILEVTFKIKDSAELGATSVSLEVTEFKQINAQFGIDNVPHTVSDGQVIVANSVPITSLQIDAPMITDMKRGEVRTFGLILNTGATGENVVWTLSDSSYALVDGATVYILNKTGTVRLIATDPVSGLSHSITLRIQ